MTDFGRRPGYMLKSVYDPNNLGYVWNSALLDQRTLAQVRGHTPQAHGHTQADITNLITALAAKAALSHTHTESQITDLDHDAQKIKGVEVDATDIDNLKVLQYNSTSGKLEYETPTGNGLDYVDRGNPDAKDMTIGDFTTDETWRDIDLSGIVDAGAKAVLCYFTMQDELVNSYMRFRRKGNTDIYNIHHFRCQVANLAIDWSFLCSLDADGKIQYWGQNKGFMELDLTVLGWFV